MALAVIGAQPSRRQRQQVRFFVSSTFRDMRAERDELAKQVFPKLRNLCEERFVWWGAVDLRWGITDEQQAEGKVLPICLAEVAACRPCFIGILGQRYGWIPHELPEELVAREPWLENYRDRSVTELEIIHGVLRDPALAARAFFYFRDEAWIRTLPRGARAEHLESPEPWEIGRYGTAEAEQRAQGRRDRLAALKEAIRRSGLPVREGYGGPKELGRLVLADLTDLISTQYLPDQSLDPLDRQALEHEAWRASRHGVYVGRAEYFARLDEHTSASADSPPLAIRGESGIGKSALVANWAHRFKAEHPDDLLLLHFVGSSPQSADWAAMLRRIVGELRRHYRLAGEIPDNAAELRSAFPAWLRQAASRGRLVLVLDGLDQLEDRDRALDLVWLPAKTPPEIRLIVTTLPGRPLEEIERRGWPTLTVQPLTKPEREQLIVGCLAESRRTLSPSHVRSIGTTAATANPLYLRALLDELLTWGEHETLRRRIDHYLEAETVPELYDRILERYEEDYERGRPGLVRDATTRLWASRRGLTEAELLDMLGADGAPLASALWSPLYMAAGRSLVSRSGLLRFSHRYIGQAVEARYLRSSRDRVETHSELAAYFARREISPRKIEELPWQLAQAGALDALYALLSDLPFVQAAWDLDANDVRSYWARVESGSKLRMPVAYHDLGKFLADPCMPDYLYTVMMLLESAGHLTTAAELWAWQISAFGRAGDRHRLREAQGRLGNLLLKLGQLDGAMARFREMEDFSRHVGADTDLQAALGSQGHIQFRRGDLDAAMRLYREQEQVCRDSGNDRMLAASLASQAEVLRRQDDFEGAKALHRREEEIVRQLGEPEMMATVLGAKAVTLWREGRLDEALALLDRQEAVARDLGNHEMLAACLTNRGLVLLDRGDFEGSLAAHREAEQVCRRIGLPYQLALSLMNQARAFASRLASSREAVAKAEEARVLVAEHGLGELKNEAAFTLAAIQAAGDPVAMAAALEKHCRETQDWDGLLRVLEGHALASSTVGDRAGLRDGLEQMAEVSRRTGRSRKLQSVLVDLATLVAESGDVEGALVLLREEADLCRQLGSWEHLAKCLALQALHLVRRLQRPAEALPLAEDALAVAETHDLAETALLTSKLVGHIRAVLQTEPGGRGAEAETQQERSGEAFAQEPGPLDEFLGAFRRAERVCREADDKQGLLGCLGAQVDVLVRAGAVGRDPRRELAIHQEISELCRELGDFRGLAMSLGNQANLLLRHMGRPEDALRISEEARTVAETHGLASLTARVERIAHEAWQQLAPAEGSHAQAQAVPSRTLLDLIQRDHQAPGQLKEHMRLLEHKEHSHRETGNTDELLACLGEQVQTLHDYGVAGRYPEGELELHRQIGRLARKSGRNEACLVSLFNQASLLLHRLDRPREALDVAHEARALAKSFWYRKYRKPIDRVLQLAARKLEGEPD